MTAAQFHLSADYLEHRGRRLFAVQLSPRVAPPVGTLLYLPPFAEEMHKARRTVAEQARALAARGYHVMLLDLSGCGDSSGDFGEARWEDWLEDAAHAVSVLRERSNLPLTLWGLRLGALLACDLSCRLSRVDQLLLWQPVLNGELQIDQFLRSQAAGLALKGESGFNRAALWEQLRAGESLEVAGYELSSRLALDIAGVRLGDIRPGAAVRWLEVCGRAGELPPASRNAIRRLEEGGTAVTSRGVVAEHFWRNIDAPASEAVLAATAELLTCS